MPLEPIEPRRLYRRIADQMRLLIEQGEFPVGTKLPAERDLAAQLGVSRPTLREALIALEVEGRLRIRVGSGVYVIAPEPAMTVFNAAMIEGPFEILQARAFVESAVAEEAARHVTAEDIARLDAVLAEAARLKPDRDGTFAADRRFHTAIAATLGNAVIVRCIGEMFDLRHNPYFDRLATHTLNQNAWKLAIEEHTLIRNAIADRDPHRARAAMREHLKRSHQRFARDFGEQHAAEHPAETRMGGLKATA